VTAFVLFGIMLTLFALSVPIPFSLGLAGTAALLTMPRVSLEVIVQRMFFGLDSFLILSVPLFLLLGELMEASRITDRLVNFAQALVGRLQGGLGHVSIVTNMLMAGISGSGTADAAATGVVLIPAMVKAGYSPPFAAALLGAAATIGPIIPPSVIMIVYASISGVSIARMFVGGVIPGVLMGACLMAITAMVARRQQLPAGQWLGAMELFRSTLRASLVLMMPLIIVGGILGGVFTATESSAIGCLYALLIAIPVYRTLGFRDLVGVFRRTALTTGKVMFVLATVSVFSWILARAGISAQLARLPVFGEGSPPWLILLALNVLLLVLGCLMEAIAILLIITPMILPIAVRAGIDPVHLGVVMSLNLSIGLITPPFGSIMFVVCGISRCSIPQFTREVGPFVALLIVSLGLVTYIPSLVLFLPAWLLGP
jgi:tripartite ATP-independent transporter DctM subunit